MGHGYVAFLNSPFICYSCTLVSQNTENINISVFSPGIFGILNTDVGIGILNIAVSVSVYRAMTRPS